MQHKVNAFCVPVPIQPLAVPFQWPFASFPVYADRVPISRALFAAPPRNVAHSIRVVDVNSPPVDVLPAMISHAQAYAIVHALLPVL